MTLRIVGYLLIFWLMQVTAQIFFKWGSSSANRWIWGFLIGNLFGFSSIWLLMLVYKAMNPNVALGIATGGAIQSGPDPMGRDRSNCRRHDRFDRRDATGGSDAPANHRHHRGNSVILAPASSSRSAGLP